MNAPLSPRKQPRQARAQATVDAILQATAQVLVEEGYDKASTNRIAKVAGVSVGSLYQYFPNKDALFLALLDDHLTEMLGILDSCIESLLSAPVPEAVRIYIDAMLLAHQREPELHRQLTELIPKLASAEEIAQVQGRAQAPVQLWLDARRDAICVADTELAAFVLVNAVETVTHSAILQRPQSISDGSLAAELTRMILGYLGVPLPEATGARTS